MLRLADILFQYIIISIYRDYLIQKGCGCKTGWGAPQHAVNARSMAVIVDLAANVQDVLIFQLKP